MPDIQKNAKPSKEIKKQKVSAKAMQIRNQSETESSVTLPSFIPNINMAGEIKTASWTELLVENIDKGMTPEIQILPNLKVKQISNFIDNIKELGPGKYDDALIADINKVEVEIIE